MADPPGIWKPELILNGDWRHGVDASAVIEFHAEGGSAPTRIKAVCVVHNETSTGVTSRRVAADAARHRPCPAIPRCCWWIPSPRWARWSTVMDAWGVDVTVGGSQKGMMLPPGL